MTFKRWLWGCGGGTRLRGERGSERAEGGIHASCEEEGGQEGPCEDRVEGQEEGSGQEEEGSGQAQVSNTFHGSTSQQDKNGDEPLGGGRGAN